MNREIALAAVVANWSEVSLIDRHVNISNELVNAAQALNLTEKRVVSCCIAKIDTMRKGGGSLVNNGLVKLSAAEYAEAAQVTPEAAYMEMRRAADNLFQRYIRIIQETKRGPKEIKFRWVSGVTYHKGEGWIEMRFTPEVAPHLVLLEKRFTSYRLAQASALRSLYSWRLLELLTQFEPTGWRQIDIEDFHHAVGAKPSHIKNYTETRRWIIEPAIKELTDKDGWNIVCEPIKSGRKVTALKFMFKRDPQGHLEL
jgi:plasmid replication initiation protein